MASDGLKTLITMGVGVIIVILLAPAIFVGGLASIPTIFKASGILGGLISNPIVVLIVIFVIILLLFGKKK